MPLLYDDVKQTNGDYTVVEFYKDSKIFVSTVPWAWIYVDDGEAYCRWPLSYNNAKLAKAIKDKEKANKKLWYDFPCTLIYKRGTLEKCSMKEKMATKTDVGVTDTEPEQIASQTTPKLTHKQSKLKKLGEPSGSNMFALPDTQDEILTSPQRKRQDNSHSNLNRTKKQDVTVSKSPSHIFVLPDTQDEILTSPQRKREDSSHSDSNRTKKQDVTVSNSPSHFKLNRSKKTDLPASSSKNLLSPSARPMQPAGSGPSGVQLLTRSSQSLHENVLDTSGSETDFELGEEQDEQEDDENFEGLSNDSDYNSNSSPKLRPSTPEVEVSENMGAFGKQVMNLLMKEHTQNKIFRAKVITFISRADLQFSGIRKELYNNRTEEPTFSLDGMTLPAETPLHLEQINNAVRDVTVREKLVKFLKQFSAPNNPGKTVPAIMRQVLSDELGQLYTWDGRVYGQAEGDNSVVKKGIGKEFPFLERALSDSFFFGCKERFNRPFLVQKAKRWLTKCSTRVLAAQAAALAAN